MQDITGFEKFWAICWCLLIKSLYPFLDSLHLLTKCAEFWQLQGFAALQIIWRNSEHHCFGSRLCHLVSATATPTTWPGPRSSTSCSTNTIAAKRLRPNPRLRRWKGAKCHPHPTMYQPKTALSNKRSLRPPRPPTLIPKLPTPRTTLMWPTKSSLLLQVCT